MEAKVATMLDKPREGLVSWRTALPVCVATEIVVGLFFLGTFASIVAIWSRSDTFAHGYFILPISLYLIWTNRESLKRLTPRPDARALVPLAFLGMVWLAATLAGVLVVEQYAVVAMIPVVVWAVLGPTLAWAMAFPLGYLLLMVPVGEALIPTMIDHTAAFTVTALRFSGVPVLQEGNFLTLPTGNWSVVEACSGLRYLIACVTMGLLFAYLTYRSWSRRVVFIAASVVVPIVANWFRAYMIVLLGHLSGMKLAVGVDHLIYGWVFYGVVMFLLLWAGSKFSDRDERERPEPVVSGGTLPSSRFALVAVAVILTAGVWPLWADFATPEGGTYPEIEIMLPERVATWSAADRGASWRPVYLGADARVGRIYESGDDFVGLHLAYFADQRQGAELVNSSNLLVDPIQQSWHKLSDERRRVLIGGEGLDVLESHVSGPGGEYLFWSWYWIDEHRTSSDVWAKVIEAKGRLLGGAVPAAGVVVYTRNDDDSRERLATFAGNALPVLEGELEALSR